VRGWGSRAVRSANARVVLATAPTEANTRVANRITLHLVDGHLGSVAVNKLNETTALARRNLDVGDFTEALEEGAELILSHVARKATDKNRSVVGIGELVHLSGRVETTGTTTVAIATLHAALLLGTPHLLLLLLGHVTTHHGVALMVAVAAVAVVVVAMMMIR
jgi:hypothetical protein